jgi:hypothetical protein
MAGGSTLGTPFGVLLFFSGLGALTLSYFCTPQIRHFTVTAYQLLCITALAIGSSSLFLLRLGWDIFDYLCPTGILGLVTQIAQGHFPASFLSFPEYPMNYHQGFLVLAGSLSYLTSILPSIAIIVTYTILYVGLIVALSLFLVYIKNSYYYAPGILFITINSIHAKYVTGIDFGWYNYVNIFEYLGSNSWPLSLLILTALFFLAKEYTHTQRNIITGSILILCTATTNATLFSVLLLTVGIIYLYHCFLQKRLLRKNFTLSFSCILILAIIPTLIPSALLHGAAYEAPQYVIRIFDSGIERYFKHIARYILLCGPIALVSFGAVVVLYKKTSFDWRAWIVGMFLVSWTFPFVFGFANIDMWDNFHKFVVLNIFLSIVILVVFYKDHILSTSQLRWYTLFCIICSLPALHDMTQHRFSINLLGHIYPAPEIVDVVTYLKENPTTLIPYISTTANLCDRANYGGIAQHAGVFMEQAYFTNFLMNAEIEAHYKKSLNWTDTEEARIATIRNLQKETALIIDKRYETEFTEALTEVPVAERKTTIHFSNFILYE